jgi:hypothetical protein
VTVDLKFHIKKEKLGRKIRFKVWNLITLCPHRKRDREDHTELEIAYTPGAYEISEEELKKYIENKIESKEIAMEMIPLKILSYCVESKALQKPGRRDATPEDMQIVSTSRGKAKKWAMTVNVKFNREIT